MKKVLTKTVSWSIIGTLISVLVAYVLTDSFVLASSIAGAERLLKIVSYYLHEAFWECRYNKGTNMPAYKDKLDALMAEDRHIIQLTDNSWTILHPFNERFGGDPSALFNCPLTLIWENNDDPGVRGRYFLNVDGTLGAAVSSPVAGIDSVV